VAAIVLVTSPLAGILTRTVAGGSHPDSNLRTFRADWSASPRTPDDAREHWSAVRQTWSDSENGRRRRSRGPQPSYSPICWTYPRWQRKAAYPI